MSAPAPTPEAVLRRLEWTVLRRLDGVLHGDYRTLFRGYGLDLADLREYVWSDDVRHIDWNVTARLQTPYVREYNEEREVAAWFLVDLSASVDFGSQPQKKRAVAAEFVAVLARILTRHGNRVGALLYGDRVDTVLPGAQRPPPRAAPDAEDGVAAGNAAGRGGRDQALPTSSRPRTASRRGGR